ncbi:DNA cytosine methyltransferase, partial [Candidatus Woesearchaeota archaeon]|nr:DNA cytosine methyltransferase [Candidatus Woesearchaeota archaeon]
MAYKILDLFAGVGGLSLGFEMIQDSNMNSVFELFRAVEIDKFACETLRKRYGADKVIEGDITKKKVSRKIIDECKGKISVVVGGIPCQSFSLIGPRSGYGKRLERFKKDKRDNLYKHFRKIVKNLRPNVIVIENVKGILSKKDSRGNKIIDKLISDFENLNYIFNNSTGEKWHLVNSADFGVPQKRERVILIGIKKSKNCASIPFMQPTHYDPSSSKSEQMQLQGLKPYV